VEIISSSLINCLQINQTSVLKKKKSLQAMLDYKANDDSCSIKSFKNKNSEDFLKDIKQFIVLKNVLK